MQKKKKILWMLVSFIMVLSLVIASCGEKAVEEKEEEEEGKVVITTEETKKEVEEEEQVVQPTGGPIYGGTLTLALAGDISSFDLMYAGAPIPQPSLGVTNDPLWAGDWAKGPAGGYGTNETDWRMSEDIFGNKAGFVADSWEWSADFEKGEGILIYHIRPGLHFSLNPTSEASRLVNGREVTADDVVYTLDQVVRNPRSYTYAAAPALRTAEITKTGEWEVTVKVAADALISAISRLGIWGRVIPKEVIDKYGNLADWRNSVGVGPFMLMDYVTGGMALFDRNPNYWHTYPVGPNMGDQLPYLDRLKWVIIPDSSSRYAALRTGKIDEMYLVDWENAIMVRQTAPKLLEAEMPPEGAWHIKWRVDMAPFNDVRVRRALMMATDFETIRRDLNGGLGDINTWPFVYHPSYADLYLGLDDPMCPEDVRELYTYNPEKAKQLLAEAGYPNGFKTEALLTSGEADYYSVLKDMWSKVGVDLDLNIMELGAMASILATKKHTAISALGLSPVGTYFDAGDFTGGGITNVSCIDDPIVNETFQKVRRVMVTDEKGAMKLVKDLMPYFLGQAYALPRPVAPTYNFWWPWIKNYAGEIYLGFGVGSANYWPTYIWIDEALKKSMGY
jgi:peptide/nickel transport system substrate-binding protein